MRSRRGLILVTTGALLVLAVWNAVWLTRYAIAQQHTIGVDYRFYVYVAERWLDTGAFYAPHQLAGPYVAETARDNLYPPLALYLFLPFARLPAILWWLVPTALLVVAIVRLRPPDWTWPILALIAWVPGTQVAYIFGNTAIWVVAAIAWGCLLGWPAPLALVKTSAAPFALIGVWRRSWWIGLIVVMLAAIPLGSLWIDYLAVVRNGAVDLGYNINSYPLLLLPVVASLGRVPWLTRLRSRTDAPSTYGTTGGVTSPDAS